MKLLIIGRGRVGRGLHRSLAKSASVRAELAGRTCSPERIAKAEVVVIAVPDDAIAAVAQDIARHLGDGVVVLHCAGARGTDELAACGARGAALGVMHPLVSFPSTRSSPSLRNTTFTVNGGRAAVRASRTIAEACGARVLVATTGDPAYHAAAALAANGAVGLAFASVEILERLGFERRAAERAIGGLLQTVGENVQRLGVPDALTGPVARGETQAIAKHRTSLRRVHRGALLAYDAAIPTIVRCAQAAGLSKRAAAAILDLRPQ